MSLVGQPRCQTWWIVIIAQLSSQTTTVVLPHLFRASVPSACSVQWSCVHWASCDRPTGVGTISNDRQSLSSGRCCNKRGCQLGVWSRAALYFAKKKFVRSGQIFLLACRCICFEISATEPLQHKNVPLRSPLVGKCAIGTTRRLLDLGFRNGADLNCTDSARASLIFAFLLRFDFWFLFFLASWLGFLTKPWYFSCFSRFFCCERNK